MSTYREELCNLDEKGIPLFSPLCQPGRTVDKSLTYQVHRSTYGDLNCFVPPVRYPKPQVPQFTDIASAKEWFRDPTYAQIAAYRQRSGKFDVPETSQSLALYHKLKTVEKVAGSLMQTISDADN